MHTTKHIGDYYTLFTPHLNLGFMFNEYGKLPFYSCILLPGIIMDPF